MKAFLFILLIFIVISCTNNSPELYKVSDFTTPNGFTSGIEGPAVDSNGVLYAVNFGEQGTIGMVDSKGVASLYVKLPEGSIGNGICFDNSGRMFIADYTKHNVLMVVNQMVTVFAHDSTMNQPNDLAISDNEILFASDPNWKDNTGKLWKIDNQGIITLLEDSMGTTNGVEVSPDNKSLYVNESIQRNVWVYDLQGIQPPQ